MALADERKSLNLHQDVAMDDAGAVKKSSSIIIAASKYRFKDLKMDFPSKRNQRKIIKQILTHTVK